LPWPKPAARPPDWEVELSAYLTARNTTLADPVILKTVARATKPRNFSGDTFYPVFGNDFRGSGGLPYPPEQVQCVRLANRHRENEVVFISYHTDQLWNIDWVVHKSVHAPASGAFLEDLQAIGCNLALSQ